ncbi:MAG: hypothetical protein U9Q24_00305 [Candidatus Ratteibacteria bacterium]|nr:hypothetical protein [Candidatus Ratteibacteria bacterium]
MKTTKGLTLIEIIIILMIIGILALFIFPNISEMRRKTEVKSCIGNLWLIQMAKNQWALDEGKVTTSTIEWSDIIPDYLDQYLVCPTTNSSDSYTLNIVGENATCTQDGHVIE